MVDLVSQSYPPNSPITSRPDWRPSKGRPGPSLADMQAQALAVSVESDYVVVDL